MDVLERDFFTDPRFSRIPIPYYHALHERGRWCASRTRGSSCSPASMRSSRSTRTTERFSAIVGPLGPLVDVPQPAEGESWAEVIERRRAEIPMGDQLTSLDPPKHTRHRTLAGRLFTPNRLKQNEDFIWTLADQLIDEFADRGEVELPRVREALHPAGDRRPARGSARGPRDVSPLARGAGQTRRPEGRQPPIRCSRIWSPTSAVTSRSVAHRRATTS